jgi:GT2 family glycosyltransferase
VNPALVVAIPAHDEARLLPGCLAALAAQREAPPFAVMVLANNCTDDTVAVAQSLAPALPYKLHVAHVMLPEGSRHAGHARGLAMARAEALLPGHGLLAGTDADAAPAPGWIAGLARHHAAGSDAIAGSALMDPASAQALPPAVRARARAEARLAQLLDRIASVLDPLPWDPWPRHTAHSGANFAVSREAYRRCGGMPDVPLSEDRLLFERLERVGARIRHAPDCVVHVSARLEGRARGGMADVLRRRGDDADPFCDTAIEPVSQVLRRHRLRRALREGVELGRLAGRLGLDGAAAAALAADLAEEQLWARLRAEAPGLRPVPVAVDRIAQQTRAAERVLHRLGVAVPPPPPEGSLV